MNLKSWRPCWTAILLAAATTPAFSVARAAPPVIVVGGADAQVASVRRLGLMGRPMVAVSYLERGPNCRPTRAEPRVVAPPFHGIVSVTSRTFGSNIAPRTLMPSVANCGAKAVAKQDVIYSPDPGFAGEDEFVLEIEEGHRRVATHVRIGVVAKPGDIPRATDNARPALPEGELVGVSVGDGAVTFIDLGHSKTQSGVASVRAYTIFWPTYTLRGRNVVQQIDERVIDCARRTYRQHRSYTDCARRTYRQHRSYTFDGLGNEILWSSGNRVEPIARSDANETIARVMCEGMKLPRQNHVKGHLAALALGRAILGDGAPH
jgi:hypothetical protein